MQTVSALRQDPYFTRMFAYVHVLCWPILVWQINRFFSALKRQGITNALYSVNRWGFIKLVHLGDKEDPGAYKPLPRIFRPLTDESYASDLPACLGIDALSLPRALGKVAPKGPERALPSPPNTS